MMQAEKLRALGVSEAAIDAVREGDIAVMAKILMEKGLENIKGDDEARFLINALESNVALWRCWQWHGSMPTGPGYPGTIVAGFLRGGGSLEIYRPPCGTGHGEGKENS